MKMVFSEVIDTHSGLFLQVKILCTRFYLVVYYVHNFIFRSLVKTCSGHTWAYLIKRPIEQFHDPEIVPFDLLSPDGQFSSELFFMEQILIERQGKEHRLFFLHIESNKQQLSESVESFCKYRENGGLEISVLI